MKLLTALALILIVAAPVHAVNIFVVGASNLNRQKGYVYATPPALSVIDATHLHLNFAGSVLGGWTAGRGTGVCEVGAFYGCMEVADDIDIVLIFHLGVNDLFEQYNTEITTAELLAAWRQYYQNIHADFPSAQIVHVTGFPMRVDSDGDTKCTDAFGFRWFLGPIAEEDDIACADFEPCINTLNGRYRYFKNQLMAANQSLPYLTYIDTWEMVVDDNPDGEALELWHDTYFNTATDCIHMKSADDTAFQAFVVEYVYPTLDEIVRGIRFQRPPLQNAVLYNATIIHQASGD